MDFVRRLIPLADPAPWGAGRPRAACAFTLAVVPRVWPVAPPARHAGPPRQWRGQPELGTTLLLGALLHAHPEAPRAGCAGAAPESVARATAYRVACTVSVARATAYRVACTVSVAVSTAPTAPHHRCAAALSRRSTAAPSSHPPGLKARGVLRHSLELERRG